MATDLPDSETLTDEYIRTYARAIVADWAEKRAETREAVARMSTTANASRHGRVAAVLREIAADLRSRGAGVA